MKTYILVLAIGLFSFSTSHAQWTDMVFDISNVHMSINGQVFVDSNGLNLSRATVTAFLPRASANWKGTAYNYLKIAPRSFGKPDGTSFRVAEIFCRKMGKRLRQSREEGIEAFESVATLDQDLNVESINNQGTGYRVIAEIECL